LDSRGIDSIVGMEWLKKYRGIICCARRVAELTTSNRIQVEFVAMVESAKTSIVNQFKGTTIEEIKVVQDYPYVFLTELPSMPPVGNRQVGKGKH
jgi:hypothetical protein